jgi:sugar lactone lactonase YvrE
VHESVAEVVSEGFAYPECPRWHDGALYFSDQYALTVYRMETDGRATSVVQVSGRPSGLGWASNGDLLVVSMLDHRLLRFDGSALHLHADLSQHHPGPSNDMVLDAYGRAYVGNIGFDFYAGESQKATAVVLVDTDGTVRVAAEDLLVPNGMVITPDGKTLIIAESFGNRLTSFTIADDGLLRDRRVFADLGNHVPDGICLDADGAVWFASAYANGCFRVVEGGEITHAVSTGARGSFACELGGPTGDTLYICSSRSHTPDEALAERTGAIETAAAPVASYTHM